MYTLEQLHMLNSQVKYPYSTSSLEKLVGVYPHMVLFAIELANVVDCRIVFGVRTDEEQNALFKMGRSSMDGYKKKSNHQKKSDGYGYALDILPLPKEVNMYLDDGNEDEIRWGQFDGLCHGIAHMLGIKVRTGFKWRDNMMDSLARPEKANTLPDGNHVELIL
jgi:hypothetical protein